MKRSRLYDEHTKRGASFIEKGGWDVPAHYGDAAAEHQAVRRGVGVTDLSHRGKLRVTGEDRSFRPRAPLIRVGGHRRPCRDAHPDRGDRRDRRGNSPAGRRAQDSLGPLLVARRTTGLEALRRARPGEPARGGWTPQGWSGPQ